LAQAQTWDPAKRLTYATGYSNKEVIAAYSTYVHVIWSDDVSGIDELYYKKSADLGTTWPAPTRLTWTGATPLSPRIGVNGTTVHIVYLQDGEVIYRGSTDNGATWSRSQITWGLDAINIEMAVSGSTVHLAITAFPSGTSFPCLYYKKSTDSGVTWGAPLNLGRIGGLMRLLASSISVSGSNVHVAYSNDTLHAGHWISIIAEAQTTVPIGAPPFQVARLG
jgi:hypothetical protein